MSVLSKPSGARSPAERCQALTAANTRCQVRAIDYRATDDGQTIPVCRHHMGKALLQSYRAPRGPRHG